MIKDNSSQIPANLRWLGIAAIVSIIARIILLGVPELLTEEAYYWNYANHLAFGYLDHPPLSAWIIALGTKIFGLNEFGVRIGAILCSVISAFFVYHLSKSLFGEKSAKISLALFALLPYFLGNSFYVSPDSPLTAAWAASLFFVVQIIRTPLSSNKQWGLWCLLGLSFGLGLLSKYPITILAFSALLTFISSSELRRWFIKPQPYIAVILAVAIFSPVLYWNAEHGWASIAFQTTRRFAAQSHFSLFPYLGHLLFLATPPVIAFALMLLADKTQLPESSDKLAHRFLKLAYGVPVGIFLFYSLRHAPRVNWSGPPLLALLPFLGNFLASEFTKNRFESMVKKSLKPILIFTSVGFAAFWFYTGGLIPGLGAKPNWNKLIGWEELAKQVLTESDRVKTETGTLPFILGMDKHYVAAELGFYLNKAAIAAKLPAPEVAGRSLVGMDSLMFDFWRPQGPIEGKNAILVARNHRDLEFEVLTSRFEKLGPIKTFTTSGRFGQPTGTYPYRIGYGYKSISDSASEASQPQMDDQSE